jgi:hypothetical protein
MLRPAALLLLATSACMSPSETVRIRGEYVTHNYDSVLVDIDDSAGGYGAAVLDIAARDEFGTLDEGTFHSATQNGPFELWVPRGESGVHLLFHQHTYDGNDKRTDYLVLDTLDHDLDVGSADLP